MTIEELNLHLDALCKMYYNIRAHKANIDIRDCSDDAEHLRCTYSALLREVRSALAYSYDAESKAYNY